jgi:hypothetical protein
MKGQRVAAPALAGLYCNNGAKGGHGITPSGMSGTPWNPQRGKKKKVDGSHQAFVKIKKSSGGQR